MLDLRTHAVRPDVADVRLAERVFAPHYAAPMARRIVSACTLREGAGVDAAEIAALAKGDLFEVLDLSGSQAWGIAVRDGLVGYIEAVGLEGVAS